METPGHDKLHLSKRGHATFVFPKNFNLNFRWRSIVQCVEVFQVDDGVAYTVRVFFYVRETRVATAYKIGLLIDPLGIAEIRYQTNFIGRSVWWCHNFKRFKLNEVAQ